MFEVMGGRKFLGFIIAVVAGSLIEIFGKNGLGANMVALIGAAYATFAASNTLITNKELATAAAPVTPAPLEVDLAEPAQTAFDSQAVTKEIRDTLIQNNQQLAGILNQIGTELANQQGANTQILEALNAVQAGQANVQKGLTIILGRGT